MWIFCIPILKDSMDLWFGLHPKGERAMQQLVVWENNDSSWANGTDYFIVDIEYDSRKGNSAPGAGGRFDLVALYWASDSAARQLKGTLRPQLVVIEMKAGDNAIKGGSGLRKHMDDYETLSEPDRAAAFISEMLSVFEQKRKLGLIPDLLNNENEITADVLAPGLEFMLLLAGHDPAKSALATEFAALSDDSAVKVCVADFMGYGLYEESIYSFTDFKARFRKQIPARAMIWPIRKLFNSMREFLAHHLDGKV
jgi:hypothetical protein